MSDVWGDARALALRLTERRSVNGTPDETSFAPFLRGVIAEAGYFEQHPDNLWLQPIDGDPLGRSAVIAFVRGVGRLTVVLTGHFDTIPTTDYGTLEPSATNPLDLLPKLVERLRATGEDAQALVDLSSGRFLPGRGLLDMKSGLAAGLVALARFSVRPQRVGNLLFVAVPDEEDSSAGMRAVAPGLRALAQNHELDLSLAINLDALGDEGDGNKGRVVALGGIGKTLLSAYVVGRETHACYPFDGLSASLIAAELVRLIECSPELADGTAPPPSTLAMRDLKGAYDVTTPGRAWCCWNIISHGRTATDFLRNVKSAAHRILTGMTERLADHADCLDRTSSFARVTKEAIKVMTFDELMAHGARQRPTFSAEVQSEAAHIAQLPGLDLPTRAQKVTEFAWRKSGLAGPAVVFGFASMPYPATKTLAELDAALLVRVSDAVGVVSKRHNVGISLAERLDVIADTSFLGPVEKDDLTTVEANTPIWGTSIKWDLTLAPTPDLPAINVGPWGRGYHRWLERVEARYAFEVLPDLILTIADHILSDMEDANGQHS